MRAIRLSVWIGHRTSCTPAEVETALEGLFGADGVLVQALAESEALQLPIGDLVSEPYQYRGVVRRRVTFRPRP